LYRHLVKRLHQATLLLLLLGLAGCTSEEALQTRIGILSGGASAEAAASAPVIAAEQQSGYDQAAKMLNLDIPTIKAIEGADVDAVQIAVRALVEENDVTAIIGSSTNEAAMKAVSLVNFFNVPMVVPSASGDNILPSNNLWAFNLSAPSSSYANYIFGSLILKPAVIPSVEGSAAANENSGRLAIIYEQNTFGESAAVAAAQAAMSLSMEITLYQPFKTENPDPMALKTLAKDVSESGAHLVYMVCSDPGMSVQLVDTLKDAYQNGLMPLLVGVEGGFASQPFLNSAEADGVYLIRQAIDRSDCPGDIDTVYEAKSYAALFLLEKALQQAEEQQPVESRLSAFINPATDELPLRREAVRDILKGINLSVPCIGQVAFDTSGQNKTQIFEILLVDDGLITSVSEDYFREALEQVIARGVLEMD